jgi:hypothetical protein
LPFDQYVASLARKRNGVGALFGDMSEAGAVEVTDGNVTLETASITTGRNIGAPGRTIR